MCTARSTSRPCTANGCPASSAMRRADPAVCSGRARPGTSRPSSASPSRASVSDRRRPCWIRPTRRPISSSANGCPNVSAISLNRARWMTNTATGCCVRSAARIAWSMRSWNRTRLHSPGGVVAQRRQLVVGQKLRDIVQNRGAHPLATPLQAAERCVQLDALAIAAPPDQRAQRPVAAAEQARLIMLGHLQQPAERGAHELVGGVPEHLAERAIARPDASVAIEGQDRSGALFRESRHEKRRIGTARHSGWPGCPQRMRDGSACRSPAREGSRRAGPPAPAPRRRCGWRADVPEKDQARGDREQQSARQRGRAVEHRPEHQAKDRRELEQARGSPAAASRLRAVGG